MTSKANQVIQCWVELSSPLEKEVFDMIQSNMRQLKDVTAACVSGQHGVS